MFEDQADLSTEQADFFQRNITDNKREEAMVTQQAKMEVMDVLPPPNHEDLQVLIMA
ncbi:unnamed protein product, partial [Gongylonema pulchrum]|uniref:TORC_N domain-containing protein n=1 Tax=Gongylonema pulchrum TaxID=637853 RepID=A0A183EC78_9BILA